MHSAFLAAKHLETHFQVTSPPELTSQLSKASETTDDGEESGEGSGSAAGYEEDDEDDDEDDGEEESKRVHHLNFPPKRD